MSKKRLPIALIAVACLLVAVCALAGCANQASTSSESASSASSSSSTSSSSSESTSATSASSSTPIDSLKGDNSGILIAYFSATGNTAKVAEDIHEAIGGDLYAIEPAEPYTEQDLTDTTGDTRPRSERDDPGSRPQIGSAPIENIEDYNIVFLGYPIWYSHAPAIVNTFITSYDFDGKTIYPFCTSEESGIETSESQLMELEGGAVWMKGMRFPTDASASEVQDWVNSLDL